MAEAESIVASAAIFLEPVLQAGQSLSVDRVVSLSKLLYPRCDGTDTELSDSQQAVVALQALQFLLQLSELFESPGANCDEIDKVLLTFSSRRIVNALIDLIAVEGIHPYLEADVGLPLLQRMRSSFQRWEPASQVQSEHSTWDSAAWSLYRGIMLLRSRSWFRPILDGRILVDILPFIFQAAYSPSIASAAVQVDIPEVLRSIGTVKLLPVIGSLLNASAPKWLQDPLTSIIASAPMRENGVRDTVNFLATTQNQHDTGNLQDNPDQPKGPVLTDQTLEKASSVIAAVPKNVDAENWFSETGPQLLRLLSSGDIDEQRIASYIIGTVLSRRNVGSPGTPGWRWLALPILGSISASEQSGYEDVLPMLTRFVSPQATIRWAVSCLSRLLLLHPNPGLVKRLGSRAYLSLWSIACVSTTNHSTKDLSNNCIRILQRYITQTGHGVLLKLLRNFFILGPSGCEFRLVYGQTGAELFLQHSLASSQSERSETQLIRELDINMQILVKIMEDLDSAALCDAFIMILERLTTSELHSSVNEIGSSKSEAEHSLVLTRTLQTMLDNFEPVLSRNPERLLPIVDTILNNYIRDHEQPRQLSAKPKLMSLRHIATSSRPDYLGNLSGMASFALGLLWILTLGIEQPSEVSKDFLDRSKSRTDPDLSSTLLRLVKLPDLPPDLLSTAQALLLQFELGSRSQVDQSKPVTLCSANGKQDDSTHRYQTALGDISSSLAPVRAQGLAGLNDLVEKGASIAISTTTISLLIALLQEDDEYVYLNALSSIRLIARRLPDECVPQLVEAFVDRQEISSLQVRLRLGEAIHKVAEDLHVPLSATFVGAVTQNMIAIAGRRSYRTKEVERRMSKNKQIEKDRLQAKKEWGGEIPEIPEDFREEVTTADEHAARIIERWAGSGREEDLRVRASALSIIGSICSTRISGLDDGDVETISRLALLIVQHETDDGAAILRRAAILLLGDLIIGLETVSRHVESIVWGMDIFQQISATLERARDEDTDDIVRGHAMEVLKSLEKTRADALQIRLHGTIRTNLTDRLEGLSLEPIDANVSRPSIEEIE